MQSIAGWLMLLFLTGPSRQQPAVDAAVLRTRLAEDSPALQAIPVVAPLLALSSPQEPEIPNPLDALPLVALQSLPPIELSAQDPAPGFIRCTGAFTLVGDDRIAFVRGRRSLRAMPAGITRPSAWR